MGSSRIPCIKAERRTHFHNSTWTDGRILQHCSNKDRVAFDQIEEFVSMGGTFKSHGNCSPVAEYNYWCDPDAAAKVYDAMYQNGRKIHMIGLDVTRRNCSDTNDS